MHLDELINHYLQREAGGNADIILGVGDDVNLGDEIGITIIATGVLGHDVNPSTGLEEKTILYLDQEDQHNNLSTTIKESEELLTACLSNSNDNNCSDESAKYSGLRKGITFRVNCSLCIRFLIIDCSILVVSIFKILIAYCF